MSDFTAVRVGAIPGRHRGGLLESWEDYAAWLEQLTADSDGYEALPRPRRLPAKRLAVREARTLAGRRT